jgi:hypothetical protein
MSDVSHVNILYSIGLQLLEAATLAKISVDADIQETLLRTQISMYQAIGQQELVNTRSKMFGIDRSLISHSTASLADVDRVWQYLIEGGVDNYRQLLNFIASRWLDFECASSIGRSGTACGYL